MITVKEHSIEESLIDKNGWVLDLGCVNFEFSLEIKKYCNNVICVDPNPNIVNIPDGISFEKAAIVSDDKNEVDYFIYNDVQGYSLLNPDRDYCSLTEVRKIKSINIKYIMEKYNIQKFELIKFDIEGSEYDILDKIDWSISKQFSVEFHDFRTMNPYYPNNELYYSNLFEKIKHKFNIVKHNNTQGHGMGLNYWDSLFVEKNENN
jgi:FkbM family methyltransferase